MIDWEREWPLIQAAAEKHSVDPFFIAAIRGTENGRPTREFGVLSTVAGNYAAQLEVACVSVKHRMQAAGVKEVSDLFIQFFGSRWAPLAADNDPDDLNANWVPNCSHLFHKFTTDGKPS
jgi:hypothetical protein